MTRASVDTTPWAHPFLQRASLERFRRFSESVWAAARRHPARRLDAAFAVNMAQNMYKWAKLADKYGADATIYLHPQDRSAISRPEWEEFEGEFTDVLDGARFLATHPSIAVRARSVDAPLTGVELWDAYHDRSPLGSWKRRIRTLARQVSPEFAFGLFQSKEARALKLRAPTVRHWPLMMLDGMYPYFAWAELLSHHEVICIASLPFPAYASGKPFCVLSVGGDLQFDCGRSDDLGRAMRESFRAASFILVSNPHTLGHCRRFGLTNAVYLPYPMDTETYVPGDGAARQGWQAHFGGSQFVLTTSRIDAGVKGQTEAVLEALFQVTKDRPQVRFVFLGWGTDAERLKRRAADRGVDDHVIVLPPVGKQRLIDYYRSCDVVLDQFVYGYLGSTALEAAAIGKPVVMRVRDDQYSALSGDDVPPVEQSTTPEAIRASLLRLLDDAAYREARGRAMRAWVVRNHGERTTAPLLLSLLQFAADRRRVPARSDNPLHDPLSAAERQYHEQCLQ